MQKTPGCAVCVLMRTLLNPIHFRQSNHRRIPSLAYEPPPCRTVWTFASANQDMRDDMGQFMAENLLEVLRVAL